MKTPYFKKVLDDVGNEWLNAQDIFEYVEEMSPFFNKWYSFIVQECGLLNYYNDHTSTAYGNPDYMYLKGVCAGWLAGRECWEDEKDGILYIKNKNNKIIMKFDIPKLSDMEKVNRKGLTELYEELLG
mgnify:CR=1 FL=1